MIQGHVINYPPKVAKQQGGDQRWERKEERIQRGLGQQTQDQARIRHLEGIVGNSYRQQSKLLDLVTEKDRRKENRKRRMGDSEEEGIGQGRENEDGKEEREEA